MPGEYNFDKRGPRCSFCGHEFSSEEKYHSALLITGQPAAEATEGSIEPEGAAPEGTEAMGPEGGLPFTRLDACGNCWEGQDPNGYFSCWKSAVPDESDAEDRPLAKRIDAESIYDMFRRLEGHAEPAQQKFRFILALMLMRRKRLRFTGVVDSPHGEHLVLEDRSEGVTHKVLDPGLAEEEIDSLRGQIDRLLGTDTEEIEAPDNPLPADGKDSG